MMQRLEYDERFRKLVERVAAVAAAHPDHASPELVLGCAEVIQRVRMAPEAPEEGAPARPRRRRKGAPPG